MRSLGIMHFSRGWLITLWYQQYLRLVTLSACLGNFDSRNSIDPFPRRSSSIFDKSKSGNGYFFSNSSFNVGCFFPVSLENPPFLFSYLGFPGIRTGSPVETAMDSLLEDFEDLGFFLNSPLSFQESDEEEDLLWRLVIVISISWAFVANSWKVLSLLIYKTYNKSHSIPWAHMSTAEASSRWSLY